MAIEICKILPLATPKEIFIKVQVFGIYVFDTLEHFSQTKEYNKICSLFPTALEKVGRKRMNSELQTPGSSSS